MSLSLPLSPQVFAILSALIEERTGLHYDVQERELLAERVSGRALERGYESLLDYYYFLRYDPAADAELALLAEALVVNETYFFRELGPLKVLVSELVPRLLARGVRPRIWCAACSTGEEPLTLAMLLDEAGTFGSSHARGQRYQRARAGSRAGRAVSTPLVALASARRGRALARRRREWHAGGAPHRPRRRLASHQLDRSTRSVGARVVRRHHLSQCADLLPGPNDRERDSSAFWHKLTVDGQLLVGASESLLRFKVAFTCEEQRGAFFYRKQPK